MKTPTDLRLSGFLHRVRSSDHDLHRGDAPSHHTARNRIGFLALLGASAELIAEVLEEAVHRLRVGLLLAIGEDVMERDVMRPIITRATDVKINPTFGVLGLHLSDEISELLDRHRSVELYGASNTVVVVQKSSHRRSPINVEGKHDQD